MKEDLVGISDDILGTVPISDPFTSPQDYGYTHMLTILPSLLFWADAMI